MKSPPAPLARGNKKNSIMTDTISLRRSFAAIVVLALIAVLSGSSAQQPSETNRAPGNSVGGAPLSDKPQELNLSGQRVRMVPLLGLNRPWALAFLPNGDMLITE